MTHELVCGQLRYRSTIRNVLANVNKQYLKTVMKYAHNNPKVTSVYKNYINAAD